MERKHWLLTKPSLQHFFQSESISTRSCFSPPLGAVIAQWQEYDRQFINVNIWRKRRSVKGLGTFFVLLKKYSMTNITWTNNDSVTCLKKTERLIFLFYLDLFMFSNPATDVISGYLSFNLNNSISHLGRSLYQPVVSACHHIFDTLVHRKINNHKKLQRYNRSVFGLVGWAVFFLK